MHDLATPNPITAPVINDQYSPIQIALDDTLFNQCHRLAQIMASGACTVPKHLQGNVGDCFAIVGQALRWGFDPYAVAQKTHLVNGVLGYEAQLIIAVINGKAPIEGRLKFEHYGDWTKVKSKTDSPADVGVRVSAVMRGDDEPTVLDLSMAQVGTVRNSPLWMADPRQQLAYLAAKRWARLYCPDVILGLYSVDELESRNSEPKDVTPKPTKNGGTASIKDRIKAKKEPEQVIEAQTQDCYDIEPELMQISQAADMQTLEAIGKEIAALKAQHDVDAITLCGDDYNRLRQAWKAQKDLISYNTLMNDIHRASLDHADDMRQKIYASGLGELRIDELADALDNHLNNLAEVS
ncbi:RecT family recombinase [Moraxella atlantae]|uniref:RecT family recombinase n=1 Tax=Faucicola atlantae TaxID=34059 RepID=UPI003753211B